MSFNALVKQLVGRLSQNRDKVADTASIKAISDCYLVFKMIINVFQL